MNPLDFSDTKNRHLARILQMQAEQNGDTAFLISDTTNVSYAEADAITARLAGGFKALGIEKGDRVCLFMANVPELILVSLALNKIAALWVPICTDYKGEWLEDSLRRSRAKIVVTDEQYAPILKSAEAALEGSHVVLLGTDNSDFPSAIPYQQLLEASPVEFNHLEHDYGDTCAILWTSGTTGKSKGVMQAHNNWIRSTLYGTSLQYTLQRGDIVYCALPLYNSGAWLTCIIRAMMAGIGCAIEQKFSVSQFMPRIKHFNATQTFAVGSMGVFLMNRPARDDDRETPLREAGISPMPPELWTEFERRFDVRLNRSGIGQSECLLSMNQESTDLDLPRHSLGVPVPDVEIKLFDDDGNEVEHGQPGEICVRPLEPHILFNGYFDNPEATASTYRGDWFLTGDMARMDPESGGYYFVDRKKDAVRFAGRNISTLEVENVVRRYPGIADVAAFGIPSEALASEDELKLDIVLQEGASTSAEQLCDFIQSVAPHYFVPRYINFVENLPYTPTNKVQKFVLRQAGVNADTWDLRQSDFFVEK